MLQDSDLISQYTEFILNNLPEWNHSKSEADISVIAQKEKFAAETAKIDRTADINSQLKQLGKIIKDSVPDNHICLFDTAKHQLVEKQNPSYSKFEYNLAYASDNELKKYLLEEVKHFKMQNGRPQWMIATSKQNSQNIGIIAIPSFAGDVDCQATVRKQFTEHLITQKKQYSWKDIIFDFRGNTGGDAEIIKEIGERLSGKSLLYADICEYVKNVPQNPEQNKIFSLKRFRRKTSPQYPSSDDDKFYGHLYILQDGWCASATEGAIYMLSQIANSTTVGETTAGTFAGGGCVNIPFSYGTLRIGTEYRERSKNGRLIKEKEGIPADIPTSAKSAYHQALKMIINHTLPHQTILSEFIRKNKNL